MTSLSVLALIVLTTSLAADPSPPPTRSAAALRTAVHETLRQWAKPAEADLDRAARELLAVYQEVERHPQMARDSKKELLVQLRSRLMNLSQQLAARRAKASVPKNVALPDGGNPALAQRGAAGQMPGAMGRGRPGGNAGLANDVQLTGDASQDLIDVIQKTIAPQSWDINGGNGSIVYWRQGMALVIRQTQEIHEAIGGLVDQLERAGR